MIAVGPWLWRDTGAGVAWTAPPSSVGGLDLRTLAQCGQRGGVPQGSGVFETTTDPGAGYLVIANNYHDIVSLLDCDRLAALLGQPDLQPMSVVDLLWELVTERSDPSQTTFSAPVLPHAPGLRRLAIGTLVDEQPTAVGSRGWLKIQDAYQRIYRAILEDVLAGRAPVGANQRVLPFFMAAMKTTDHTLFIPPDLPVVEPLKPTTTLTDDFNRANANPISNAPAGWAWALAGGSGNWQIFFNLCNLSLAAQDHVLRAESSLSGVDMYTKATAAAGSGGFFGVAVRMNSASENGYVGLGTFTGGNDCRISKMVAGARTDLSPSGAGATFALGDTIKTGVAGSALSLYKNTSTTAIRTVTDTTFASGSRGGMWQFSAGVTLNYFETADAGATVYTLTAAPDSYAETGTAAILRVLRMLSAASGTYDLTGTAAALRVTHTITVASGTYGLTGSAAALQATRTLVCGATSYASSGTAAVLRAARRVIAAPGSYTWTGTGAGFVYSGAGLTHTLTAIPGTYAWSGTTAGLRVARLWHLVAGGFGEFGTDAALRATRVFGVAEGTYGLTGTAATFIYEPSGVASSTPVTTTFQIRRQVAAAFTLTRPESPTVSPALH